MRSAEPECEHGAPGGTPTTCALCRVEQAKAARVAHLRDLFDPRAAAAGER